MNPVVTLVLLLAASSGEATLPPPVSMQHDAAPSDAELKWAVPSAWVEETPSSTMRRAQYRVPGTAGAGECAVFYFGPGQGGDAMSNAKRWAGQFTRPDGSPASDGMKTSTFTVGGIPVLVVEVSGTYNGGMTTTAEPAKPKPGYALVGAIAEGPDANWFFKLTGPAATVAAQRDAFLGLVKSLKRGGA